jgi:hypothetical protein
MSPIHGRQPAAKIKSMARPRTSIRFALWKLRAHQTFRTTRALRAMHCHLERRDRSASDPELQSFAAGVCANCSLDCAGI